MMTALEQAIVRMHNAGLSDAEIVAVMAMRGDQASIDNSAWQARLIAARRQSEIDLMQQVADMPL